MKAVINAPLLNFWLTGTYPSIVSGCFENTVDPDDTQGRFLIATTPVAKPLLTYCFNVLVIDSASVDTATTAAPL